MTVCRAYRVAVFILYGERKRCLDSYVVKPIFAAVDREHYMPSATGPLRRLGQFNVERNRKGNRAACGAGITGDRRLKLFARNIYIRAFAGCKISPEIIAEFYLGGKRGYRSIAREGFKLEGKAIGAACNKVLSRIRPVVREQDRTVVKITALV